MLDLLNMKDVEKSPILMILSQLGCCYSKLGWLDFDDDNWINLT